MNTKTPVEMSGHVFRLGSDFDLEHLDAYEESYPAAIDKSLFLRKPVQVRLADGSTVECWVSEYNRPLPAVKQARRAKA